jgi:hypothetical protein
LFGDREGVVVSLPWYLLAAGMVLVVIGFILACLPGPPGRGRRSIDPDMRDDDIVRELKRGQRVPVSNFVILAGFACILVSICWRLVRAIL